MSYERSVLDQILQIHQRQLAGGAVLTREQIDRCHATFRARFGPEVLAGLDGVPLLEAMHLHGNKDSLVYWLEFKNDDELPTAQFGSIQGGSALKFGIYQRQETGQWMTGAPISQQVVSLDDAVTIARRHRDQFIAGTRHLDQCNRRSEGINYAELQSEMERIAPDVADTAWGHKYFHLTHPELIDDYHKTVHQRFHLIKLHQMPPDGRGRYVCAGAYMALCQALALPINQVSTALNERHGDPHPYWRVGTSFGDQRRTEWQRMREQGFVGIGWNELGDVAGIPGTGEGREALRQLIQRWYPKSPQSIGQAVSQVFRFLHTVTQGDYVFAADGATILGVGKIAGDYQFEDGPGFAHRRSVEWLSTEEWPLPVQEGLRTSLFEMKKPENLLEAERRISSSSRVTQAGPGPVALQPLQGIPARIQSALERKKQVVLYGPPGTGKTHWAEITARELAARSWFGRGYTELDPTEQRSLPVEICTFHPACGYEDFLEGYRPLEKSGTLIYELRDGIFKRLCRRAEEQPGRDFFLIIDEINRGDIPRIFGELLTAIEKTARGRKVTLPLSNVPFAVPSNVYMIGTMNTADRSIALLDAALRRRFAFVELMPDITVLGDAAAGGVPLGPWLRALNEAIREHMGRNGRNLQIGHSYLLHERNPVTDNVRFVRILRDDILPLLEEYCYEDYAALERILGPGLVDRARQRIREELFDPAHREELRTALLARCPEITTTRQAVASDAQEPDPEDEEEPSGQLDQKESVVA